MALAEYPAVTHPKKRGSITLQPLQPQIISAEYRLAPEYKFPTRINDSLDVFHQLLSEPGTFFHGLDIKPDLGRLIIAGSSAGAAIIERDTK